MLGPLMVVFMINRVAERQREAEEVRIPIVGIENDPRARRLARQQRASR